jgi:tetratricopeptide (TPR) repeat protein
MTDRRDFKSIVRDRQRKTGESYTAARAHVERERRQMLGIPDEPATTQAPAQVDAAVLKVGSSMVRIRILGEEASITLRASGVAELVPGQIVTVKIEKRWSFRGDPYASGQIERARIDIAALGLVPLPLDGGELEDLRASYEPYRDPDPYAPLWRELTAKPRACYEMDPIAWGAFPDADPEDNPTIDAVELRGQGDLEGARQLLMDVLLEDLRCLDAHAHLGNFVFERSPARALVHYEIGVRIGELSLPSSFDGVLLWGQLYNRPFLRCLHGLGLCLWRLGRADEAQRVFERILALNPNDNQGVRECWHDVRAGLTWDEAQARDELAAAERAQAARAAREAWLRQRRDGAGDIDGDPGVS